MNSENKRQTTRDWPASRSAKATFTLFILITAALSYAPSILYYQEIQHDREQYFGGEVAAASADSYYWFRAAREIHAGTWRTGERDALRRYPDGAIRGDAPWISRAIAFLARWTDGDVYRAGQWFALATSCLFVFPLILYCARVGWPAAGLLAALIATSSAVLTNRTWVLWVDTDAVNLFALFAICLIFSLNVPSRPFRTQLAMAALAGTSVALFIGWYGKTGFYVVYSAAFVLCLFGSGFPTRRVALLTAVFLVFGNPSNLSPSVSHLSNTVEKYAEHFFSNESETTTDEVADRSDADPLERFETGSMTASEMKPLSYADGLAMVLEPAWLAAVGVLCWLAWALRHWRQSAPLLPVAGLAAMGLLVGNRFLMYLAPLAGLGLGVALTSLVRLLAKRARHAAHAEVAACVVACGLFVLLLSASHDARRPPLTVNGKFLRSLQRAAHELPPAAAVWYAWGEGYLVQDVMGAATYMDGNPDPVVEQIYQQGLTSSAPRELQRSIAYLHANPKSDVRSAFHADYFAAHESLMAASGVITGDAFLLLTRRSMTLLSKRFEDVGWDTRLGWSEPEPVIHLRCRPEGANDLACLDRKGQRLRVDPVRGRLDGRDAIERLVYVRDGFVVGGRRFPHRPGFALQILQPDPGQPMVAYLMGARAFESNLNQLYALGRWDERYFELVYDDFPTARLFRVRDARDPKD